jgi:hypothetical protein
MHERTLLKFAHEGQLSFAHVASQNVIAAQYRREMTKAD